VCHVVQGLLSRRRDQERAIGTFDEGHHSNEPDPHLIGCERVDGLPETRTSGGNAAERDSTYEITTIHI
jgi:hypothetical protein